MIKQFIFDKEQGIIKIELEEVVSIPTSKKNTSSADDTLEQINKLIVKSPTYQDKDRIEMLNGKLDKMRKNVSIEIAKMLSGIDMQDVKPGENTQQNGDKSQVENVASFFDGLIRFSPESYSELAKDVFNIISKKVYTPDGFSDSHNEYEYVNLKRLEEYNFDLVQCLLAELPAKYLTFFFKSFRSLLLIK